jgi:hypothetical protein
MKNGKVFIWMQLLGFDRNDPDRGAKRFLDQTGFVPDGACALIFHPDFFHLHRRMDEEYTLPPDNCAYYGIPRNAERERQPWTNYDLRELARSLTAQGSHLYASVMGSYLKDAFHREWATDHPEIHSHGRGGAPGGGHNALKRFSDGTYYEDFFIDKLCQTLTDYGMRGVHLADGFCPNCVGALQNQDFSTDFVTQFTDHTGITLPPEVAATLGTDDQAAESRRSDYVYTHLREQWIHFNAWRWERFFSKLCGRVHAIGREVIVLGMYCTDPFETLYCNGIDLNRIVRAGVDYISANILPTSCYLCDDSGHYYFHRYMAIAPLTAAHLPKGHLISMLGVQDASEEWDAMHHAPCLHERDMYTMMAYQLVDGDGTSRALDGFFLCLGDGIRRQDWDWERERLEIAMSADAVATVSPAMLWSDAAHDAMLHEYIRTRRWTPHKLFYELAKAGAHCAAAVRSDALDGYSGTLVVPNFDMLADGEKRAVAAYDRGAVLCTACPGFDPAAYGIVPEVCFCDGFSAYPLTAFAFGCRVGDDTRAATAAWLSQDDGAPDLTGPLENVPDFQYTLVDTLVFSKVTAGFAKAMARLLTDISDCPFTADKPLIALKRANGAYRLYLFNTDDNHYGRAFVTSARPIQNVDIISKFPILPPRFLDEASGRLTHLYVGKQQPGRSFEIKLQPGGVTIVDVYC